MQSVVNSYLGIFSHYKSYGIRRQLFQPIVSIQKFGRFTNFMRRFIPFGA